MKKLMIIPIFLAFGIALMQVAGVPAPSIVESFQASVAFKRHVANGMTPLEAGDLSNVISLFHKWRMIVAKEFSIGAAFADFEPVQLGTPTQTIVPAHTVQLRPPVDRVTLSPMSTEALPSTLLSAATPAFTPRSTRAGTPVNNLSPTGIGIAIFASTGKDIPAAALNPTNMATATTVTWATWTATVTGVATNMATYTVRVKPEPPSPLLDRLIKNKPSVWGNKGFYVLLGALYLTLLGLFLRQILDTVKRRS